MTQFDDLYLIPKTIYYADGDTSFVVGDSPATYDVKTALGKIGTDGYIICDGAGDILLTISHDGTNYGNSIRLKSGEKFTLRAISVSKIKITHSGTDSGYRLYAV